MGRRTSSRLAPSSVSTFRSRVSAATLVAFSIHLAACTHTVKIAPVEVQPVEKIQAAVLVSGELIRFVDPGAVYDPETRTIAGRIESGETRSIPLGEVLTLEITREDVAGTLALTVVVLAAAAFTGLAIYALTKESCPFIYSYDGERFRFDAEPLGGAVCAGLARMDLSRLDHLRPTHRATGVLPEGSLLLLVRNEVEETQFLDAMRLLAVDHLPEEEVVAGADGRLYLVGKSTHPASVVDDSGKNVTQFFRGKDGVAWQSKLPVDPGFLSHPLREGLVFTFPRPRSGTPIYLLANAGDTLWGSHMIRMLLELMGKDVDAWYADVAAGGPRWARLQKMLVREELYHLNVDVWTGGGWKNASVIVANGPLCIEDRLVPLDLAGATGDSIRVRIRPPFGFWSIDRFELATDVRPAAEVFDLAPSWVLDPEGRNLLDPLAQVEGTYLQLPKNGDSFRVAFSPPPSAREGFNRDWYLKTTGYYELHLERSRPADAQRLDAVQDVPEAVLQYSQGTYREWLGILVSRSESRR